MVNDKWGILREHSKYYGVLRNTSISSSKKHYFEQLLKSSLSLDLNVKVKILVEGSHFSVYTIEKIISIFEEDLSTFNSSYLEDKEKIKLLIKEKELEWGKIEVYLEDCLSGDISIDKDNHLTPSSIQHIMGKFVKGQKEATKSVSTLLYYHSKIYFAYRENSKLPFKTPEPILISGATGTGKSFILEVGCDIIGLPFLHIDCSALVSSGIVGYTINGMMKDLLRKVDYDVRKAETAIILLDEIDKLLAHYDGESILYQLLRIVEGAIFPIDGYRKEDELRKIHSISTHNMLFIFSGSFQKIIDEKNTQQDFKGDRPIQLDCIDIEATGLPKELLGRINKIVILNDLKREDYKAILLNSTQTPLEQIKAMLAINDQDFLIDDAAIESILDKTENSPYGARALKHLIWEHFESVLHDAPNINIANSTGD